GLPERDRLAEEERDRPRPGQQRRDVPTAEPGRLGGPDARFGLDHAIALTCPRRSTRTRSHAGTRPLALTQLIAWDQCTEVERYQARSAMAQRNHIGLPLWAFLRPEYDAFTQGVSRLEAKRAIIRAAVRS